MLMDEVALGAVSAVWHGDTAEAQRWLDRISAEARACRDATADGHAPSWPEVKRTLLAWRDDGVFPAETIDGFVAYLETYAPSPVDVLVQLAAPSADDLLQIYTRAVQATTM